MASTCQQDGETMPFPNNGRGVFIYTKRIPKNGVLEIFLVLKNRTKPKEEYSANRTKPKEEYLAIRISGQGCSMDVRDSTNIINDSIKPEKHVGLEEDKMASYWISIDRDSFLIKYGKGYLMAETTCMTFPLKDHKENEFVKNLFNPAKPLYLMVFISSEPLVQSNVMIDAEPAFQFKTRPLAGNLPPLVKDSSTVTLFDLDRGQYTFSDDLPTASQQLYNIVKGCELEYPENPAIKLSDAIRYSINTKGRCLYEIMEDKKKGSYYTEGHVYIRVTMGPDMLTAPGSQFVLELWPSGNESAVHNHGSACAIIKILFGRMKISIYNKLPNPVPKKCCFAPLMTFDAKQGDFTWMDENWYQTHKLENITDDFCATLNSYRYRSDDSMQWPGLDYIQEEEGHQETLHNTSDITFRKMREKVLREYAEYLTGNSVNGTG